MRARTDLDKYEEMGRQKTSSYVAQKHNGGLSVTLAPPLNEDNHDPRQQSNHSVTENSALLDKVAVIKNADSIGGGTSSGVMSSRKLSSQFVKSVTTVGQK